MKKFFVQYKRYIKAATFLLISIIFISVAGVSIKQGKTINLLDLQLQIGESITIPLFFIIKGTSVVLVGLWLAIRTISFCERSIRHFTQINLASQSILMNIIQIFVYFIFFIAVLDALNFQASSIAVISGAAAFGLSLGLRQIASNVVSGFVLLLERSINVGDFVETKEKEVGFVRRIGTLYTHLEMTTGKEIFIPNAEIFNQLSANWTLSNREARVDFELVVEYTADIQKIHDICHQIMNVHPCRSEKYEPILFVDRFGDYGLVLKIQFWLDDIFLGRSRVRSELLTEICTVLKANKIHIPSYASVPVAARK